MPVELILGLLAMFTSFVAAVIGLGGGMLLIAIMPIFISPEKIIPLHGVTQLASNISRVAFSLKDVAWHCLPPFLFGSLVGVAVFALAFFTVPTAFVPVLIGIYILLSLWSGGFNRLVKRYESFFAAGFFQSGLGLLVGATGPLTMTLLVKRLSDSNKVIVTAALFMSLSHLLKILLFGLVGFAYDQHIPLLTSMVFGAAIGSFLGTRLRRRFNGEKFRQLLIWILTGLALHMIAQPLINLII